MLSTVWNTILVHPIFNILVGLYRLTGSLGASIVLLTAFIRTALIPIILPSIKSMKKQKELRPQLEKIRKKYKHDKQKQAEKQMELFKKHGINPASGCLNQIAMIVILIALYGVIRKFATGSGVDLTQLNDIIYFDSLKFSSLEDIKTRFLYMDLAKPDPYYILAALSGGLQLLASKMLAPYAEAGEKAASKTPDKADDIAYNVQSQMLYTLPIMNFIIGLRLPAGVVLYILTTTIFSIGQNYFVSGLGGLKPWIDKVKKWIKKK